MRSFFFFYFIFQLLIEEEEAEKKIRRKKKQRERERSSLIQATKSGRVKGLPVAFRHSEEREILTGERGNEVSFKMVRARALRGRLWMRINLDSAQDLFNLAATPKRRNNDGRTSSSLLRPGSFPPPLSLPPPSLIYIEEPAFEVAPRQATINLHHHGRGPFRLACLSHL